MVLGMTVLPLVSSDISDKTMLPSAKGYALPLVGKNSLSKNTLNDRIMGIANSFLSMSSGTLKSFQY